jgi:hypothetical protein
MRELGEQRYVYLFSVMVMDIINGTVQPAVLFLICNCCRETGKKAIVDFADEDENQPAKLKLTRVAIR